jgi:hypothetical protein
VPFSRTAEQRIREAINRGEFENLPNAGRPLDLEGYFSAPPDLRMAYSLLKNANCTPAEVELLTEVACLKREIAATGDPAPKTALERTLATRQTQLAMLLERRRPGEK